MYRNDWYGTADHEYELSDEMYHLKDLLLKIVAVSYTHLDVYKRQIKSSINAIQNNIPHIIRPTEQKTHSKGKSR